MRSAAPEYAIPLSPPPDALAELDAAACKLDELRTRAVAVTVDMDEQTRSLRIELDEGAGPRRLTPLQLLELLAGA
ncbi:MAG: hypothetical protein H0V45_05055 [Actinobacteria bacterium]|nr:hypothetical protein [Actinomycetota bacterium]